MEREELAGERGGGIAIALGIRARGVLRDGLPLTGEFVDIPKLEVDIRPPNPGLGVLKGDPWERLGEESSLEEYADVSDRTGLLGSVI